MSNDRVREALKKRAWWCSLRSAFPEAQDDAVADFERALRAAPELLGVARECVEHSARVDPDLRARLEAAIAKAETPYNLGG